jgi:hypothetical protein
MHFRFLLIAVVESTPEPPAAVSVPAISSARAKQSVHDAILRRSATGLLVWMAILTFATIALLEFDKFLAIFNSVREHLPG